MIVHSKICPCVFTCVRIMMFCEIRRSDASALYKINIIITDAAANKKKQFQKTKK